MFIQTKNEFSKAERFRNEGNFIQAKISYSNAENLFNQSQEANSAQGAKKAME
jgi:hypothetical protein